MKQHLKTLALASSVLMTLAACSQAASTSNTDEIKQAFEKQFPNRKVNTITPTPVAGIYEIVVEGKQVVYSTADANYLFVGDLIDATKKESLTEKTTAELNKVDFNNLPLQHAIKEVRGNGQRKLAIFSDPDCPFCKKLEHEGLKDLNNVTIYTFLYPLTELHPDAMRKSQQIMCSANPLKAWNSFMREGKALSGATNCSTPLAEIQALGNKLGIRGTPALIFSSGQLIPGAIDGAQIEQLLSSK
ncbi:DsbC family protein [Neisseriaceae bacterium TC5R-5]|nr:DsbC family protein [Neisseriaceae bacterium TC5R-5]